MSEIAASSEFTSTRSLLSGVSDEDPVRFSLDLVAAAARNLKFLRDVEDSDWLHQRAAVSEAVRRYDQLWMPLISDLTVGNSPPQPPIVPPYDVEWVWYCHTLNPVHYREYCELRFSKLIGKPLIFDEENEEYAFNRCRQIWRKKYPDEPIDNEVDSESLEESIMANEEILSLVLKNRNLFSKFSEAYMGEMVYLIAAKRRYKKLLHILQGFGDLCFCFVPTFDILLMWITHQSYHTVYAADTGHMEGELMKVVGPWDWATEEDIEETKRVWETTFDQPYEKAGGRIALEPEGGNPAQPPVYWVASDTDVNVKYKSLHPRFYLEVCVFVRLRSQTDATLAEKTREFLRLQMLRCHSDLKLDKPISKFPSDSWQKAWHLYCEFGTKGIRLELRHSGSLCFKGTGLLDNASVMWNDLLRAPSLTIGREIDQKLRVFTSITPPVQAPYLLKCVPDRVTDDSGAMISDVMLRLNQYRPQEGRWLSRTVLDHAGRECFIIRIRVGGGFWRRGGEHPTTVKWEDRIIEIREGSWSYVPGSTIGKAPEKVVGTAKPKEESKEGRASWSFSTGDELTIQWEPTASTGNLSLPTASTGNLSFLISNQNSESSVKLLKGRKMQYNPNKQKQSEEADEEEEERFITLVRCTDENPDGKATALLNWKLLAMEILPEEDAVFVLLLSLVILRSVTEFKKEDVGGLLIRRRVKETKLGARDWGSVILDPCSYPSSGLSPYVQPWYWNAKAVLAHDHGAEQTARQPGLNFACAEGSDKLYKRGIIS